MIVSNKTSLKGILRDKESPHLLITEKEAEVKDVYEYYLELLLRYEKDFAKKIISLYLFLEDFNEIKPVEVLTEERIEKGLYEKSVALFEEFDLLEPLLKGFEKLKKFEVKKNKIIVNKEELTDKDGEEVNMKVELNRLGKIFKLFANVEIKEKTEEINLKEEDEIFAKIEIDFEY